MGEPLIFMAASLRLPVMDKAPNSRHYLFYFQNFQRSKK
jgi:hypothetical protein